MTITHIKGTHFSIPPIFRIFFKKRKHVWKVIFTDASYTIEGEDQWDWNKLCGVSFTINAQKESAMVGWRYNPEKSMFELCAYCHVAGKRIYTEALNAVEKEAYIEIDIKGSEYHFLLNGVKHVQKFNHTKKAHRKVNSWFGGNKPAPRTLKFVFA